MEERRIKIYTDGSCDNIRYPNYGGWAYLILEDDCVIEEKSGNEVHTTNNRMEMFAIISSLVNIPKFSKVEIITDSKYCIYAFTNNPSYYAKNLDLIEQFAEIVNNKCIDVKFKWVRGHCGDKYNEIVDKMANDEFEKASGEKITDFKRLKTDPEYKREVFKNYQFDARDKMLAELITEIINDEGVKNHNYVLEKVRDINTIFKIKRF